MWGKKGGRKKGQKAVKFNDGKYSEDQLVAEGFRDEGSVSFSAQQEAEQGDRGGDAAAARQA